MTDILTKAIDTLVTERTFSLEAVEAIRELKQLAATLEEKLDDRDEQLKALSHNYDQLRKSHQDAVAENMKLRDKLVDIEERERKACRAIFDAEKHQAVADTLRWTFETVMRPAAVRNEIHRQVAVPVAGGGSYSGFVQREHETENTLTTQE